MTEVRTVKVELTSDDVRYILHALREFKLACREKVDADETGDGDLTHFYANDIMEAKLIHEKIEGLAVPVFGEGVREFSYELL